MTTMLIEEPRAGWARYDGEGNYLGSVALDVDPFHEFEIAVRAAVRNVNRPLLTVQLGWALTAWMVWKVIRGR